MLLKTLPATWILLRIVGRMDTACFFVSKALANLCGCYSHGFSRIKEQVDASFPLGGQRMSSFTASLVCDSILLKL